MSWNLFLICDSSFFCSFFFQHLWPNLFLASKSSCSFFSSRSTRCGTSRSQSALNSFCFSRNFLCLSLFAAVAAACWSRGRLAIFCFSFFLGPVPQRIVRYLSCVLLLRIAASLLVSANFPLKPIDSLTRLPWLWKSVQVTIGHILIVYGRSTK